MKKQESGALLFNLNPQYFPEKAIIPFDTLLSFRNKYDEIYYRKIREKYGTSLFNVISLPLFSIDRKTVLINKSKRGQGGIYIYRKRNNNWEKVKTLSDWIE
jgi:hypothetical protein